MMKQYFLLGIFICMGIALAALPIRLSSNDDSISFFLISKIVSYTFTVSIISFFLHHYLLRLKAYLSATKYPVGLALLCIFSVALVIVPVDFVFDYIFRVLLRENPLPYHPLDQKIILLVFRSSIISCLFFFIVYYMRLLDEKQQRKLEIEKLKQAQLEANLSNLKEQMNPHFLFNTLNTLSSISEEKQVKDYISELAKVYRYMLVHNKLNVITLSQELDFINSYLYIIKTRMGKSIQINMDIDRNLMSCKMPPLTLQLLLENAIKHNITSQNQPLEIVIYTTENFLIVKNNYNPKNSTQYTTGVGLNNLMNRYQLLFSENIIIEKDDKIFSVKLPVIC